MCAAKYLHEESDDEKILVIKTHDMVHSVYIPTQGMQKERRYTVELELFTSLENTILMENLTFNMTNVFIGRPYAVVFCDSLETFPLAQVANDLRVSRLITYDTDIVAAKVLNPNQIKIRIYNRMRGELYASGNAAVAVATVAFANRFTPDKVEVICTGGAYITSLSPKNDNQVKIVGEVKPI